MMLRFEESRRQFSAAVGTGNIRAGQAHRIKSLAGIVKSGCQKTLLSVFAQKWVAAQGVVHRYVHDVATVEAEPANRAGVFTLQVWVGDSRWWRRCRIRIEQWGWRWKWGCFSLSIARWLRNQELSSAMRAINRLTGGGNVRLKFLPAERA
jgi:hypothetical protein